MPSEGRIQKGAHPAGTRPASELQQPPSAPPAGSPAPAQHPPEQEREEARRIAAEYVGDPGYAEDPEAADALLLAEQFLALASEHQQLKEAAWNAVRQNAIINPEAAQTRLNELDNVLIGLGDA